MEYLTKDEKLELKYQSGKGAWTYHLRIPNSKNISGKWGDIKVSGYIDNYEIVARNPLYDGSTIVGVYFEFYSNNAKFKHKNN